MCAPKMHTCYTKVVYVIPKKLAFLADQKCDGISPSLGMSLRPSSIVHCVVLDRR